MPNDPKHSVISSMRKRYAVLFLSVGTSFFFICLCFGQNKKELAKPSMQISLHSKILNEERPLFISLPREKRGGNYPVLYILDGDGNTNVISGIVDYLSFCKIIPKMIVVGIGNTERIRDMAPSKSTKFRSSGGAENFHKFLTEELIPHIENLYPSSSERLLLGHSLGGLFSLYALLQGPEIFDAYIAISPSIQYKNFEYPPVIERFFSNNQGLHGFLFMSFADEGNGGAFRRLNELYQNILPNTGDDFNMYCRQYPHHNHLTALIPAASDALITYFKGH